ncbi:carbohydrate ABC transporter permease [Pseudovibrio exalbescens]|uniref:carbohydrate ABC transporter permease n=1 Tax=Pseudovibrio exalbescens TaxID=197461 RepID=UPI00236619F7|nr:carbohydrate ABC transporter permease [Pseudovibrio exalbescens]MDD7909280.1 carbohydrate ABC transporter permease [Pseudovibrio exalbescens]
MKALMKRLPKISMHAFLIVSVLITIFPFVWVAMMGTHSRSEIFSSPPPFYFGSRLLENYEKLLDIMPFWLVLGNSLMVSIIGTAVTVLFCSMCAYGFFAYEFRGKNVVFGVMVASMMVPPVLTLIPFFLTVKFLGLLDTHAAIWLPLAANAMGIFLIRQYMVTSISRDLLDAAKVDGASDFRTYWTVVLPLIKPALATLGIVTFIALWNNFLLPLIVISSPDKYVLTLALRSLQSVANTPWGAVMLGTFLSMIPLLVAFLFFSKQMMAGLTAGAVKG